MAIDPILARHGRILEASDTLETLIGGSRPDRIDSLAEARWDFTRETLMHCAQMSDLFAELLADYRTEAVAAARIGEERARQFVAGFREHAVQWHGFPAARAWADYRTAIGRLTAATRHLIDEEARTIVPLLPVRPSGMPAQFGRHRYVEEIWNVRRLIFDANERPIT